MNVLFAAVHESAHVREGKNAIAGYKVEGQQLFVPNGYLSRY